MEVDRITAAVGVIEEELRSFRPDLVDRASAARLVSVFAQGEKACAAGTALLARLVGDAAALARTTGTSVGKARAVIGLSQCLRDTPDLYRAVRDATVSLDQATEIAKAETAAPGSAADLIGVAREQPYHVLREQARARALEDTRADLGERQRRSRLGSHRVTDLGMIHIEADLEPHIGTPIVEQLEIRARRLRIAARSEGRDETWSAHLADAIAEALTQPGTGLSARPEMVILVSHDVARRGWTDVADGEVCAIPGVGPVDPKAAREIAEDAFLSGVFYDGEDLRHVRTWTRHIPREVRLALRLGDPPGFDGSRCVDCGNRWGLEHDHVEPYAAGGPGSTANLRPRCRPCHRAKTRADRRAGRAARATAADGDIRDRDPPPHG
jgi:hypothetical protein